MAHRRGFEDGFLSPSPYNTFQSGVQKPFHDYLLTYLTGNKMDITKLFPCADSRRARRAHTDVSEIAFLPYPHAEKGTCQNITLRGCD